MSMTIQWFGDKISKDMAGNVKAAVHDIAKLIEGDVKSNAPTGKTGKLKRSVKTVETEKDGEYLAFVKVGSRTKGGAYYAGFVELGTKLLPAKPFVRPAIRKNKAKAERKLHEAVRRALK